MNERDLFMAALQIEDATGRSAYLDRACAGEAALRQRVEALLAAFEQAGSFLQQPAGVPRATADVSHPGTSCGSDPAEGPGTVIGPYKLLEQIGEGGMGTVWMAQQTEPVKRLVAVKLIKAGMDSKQVIARFEAERQALALMDHTNIARVLDAGTSDAGRPYFVMDLVNGVPITRYCDEHHLTPRQRLELFIPVCQAVQHAHQKGIIHRDLKPSNVLVALYDGKPVPRVIDFGVAKAAGQSLTDKTLVTGFGNIVGTLEYMSPEQAEVNNQDIDTRSDIYSLGVLLYELLTGSPPFSKKDLEKAGMLEMLRVIREQEPSKPSTKLSTADGLPMLAANRGTEPAKLMRLVRGELDWIVMKALEKDRNRRYETANGFAADVQLYLADEAVQACPPSMAYRCRKFVRRNWQVLMTVGVAAVSLLVGLLLVVVLLVNHAAQMKEANQQTGKERDRAESALQRADQNLALALEALDDVYMKDVEDRILRDKRMTKVERDSVAKGVQFYERFARQNSGHAELERVTAKAYRRAGSLRLNLKDWPEAQAQFTRAIAVFEQWADESRGSVEDREELARCCSGLAVGLTNAGRGREAPPISRRAIALWEKLATEFPQAPNYRVEVGHCLWEFARALSSTQEHAEAEKAMRESHQVFEALAAAYPKEPYYRQEIGLSHRALGNVFQAAGRQREATESFGKAVPIYADLLQAAPESSFYKAELAWSYYGIGTGSLILGRVDEAIGHFRKVIELQPDYALGHFQLGAAYGMQGKPDQAVAEFHTAIDLEPNVVNFHYNLGCVLAMQGKLDEAMAEFRTALGLKPHRYDAHGMKPDYAKAHANLGDCLQAQGKLDEAIAEYRAALRTKQIFPEVYGAHYNLGNCLQRQGKLDEAIAEYRAAIGVKEDFPEVHCNLGMALVGKVEFVQALTSLKRGHELGSRDPTWPYPSAQWVQRVERLVQLSANLPRLLAGKQASADGRERLAVGFLCYCRRQYELATRFYEQALAQEPGLTEDLTSGNRYDAACNAALAGIGEGQDAAAPGSEQRSRRRRQSYDWLRADLRQHARALENAAPAARAATARRLNVWLQDTDLRGLRDAAYLAKLPAEERKAYVKLWTEVRELLSKAQSKK
jgi:serine/threonine protein kinase/tetratricopeptide (TPR) repeat protein